MDIGAVLNGNHAQQQKASSALSGNFDTFLKLLTTQLQNQDPLAPMDSTKFTEQLVSYSQVEQQINTNQKLADLLTVATTSLGANAVTYLGKTALSSDGISPITGADDNASWRYIVPEGAKSVKLVIRNADGDVVRSFDGEIDGGSHDISWDGKNTAGEEVPAGAYTMTAIVKGPDDKEIAGTKIYGIGLIKEIDMSGAEPLLTIGDRRIGLTK